jgi:hypothetical protein
MAANSIDSAQYVDGSIDRAHLAADIIDGTKIADDVINSEHYAAGSIDAEHMAANSIDSAAYVDGSIDDVHIASTPTVASGNNTIVKRHSSGYIYANYFHTTPDTVTTGVTQICIEQGNNGFIRHGTAAAVNEFLGNLSLAGGTMTGDITTPEDIISTGRDNGNFGTYSSTLTDHIWSMGTSYRNHASGTDFGNLYGFAYKHTNNATGGHMAFGHQGVWVQNGTPTASMGNGLWTSGSVTANPTSTTLIKNSAGTTLKTIHGITST